MQDILVILDRSGSMQARRADHEGGLRSFVRDQAEAGDDAWFTLVLFDDVNPCEVVIDRQPIDRVRDTDLHLIPRGATPLLDAIGKAVANLEERQRTEPSEHTLVMIVTDGQENASKEWSRARVKQLLTDKEAAGWTLLYLGANVDAFTEGGAIGVAAAVTANYAATAGAVAAAYTSVSSNYARARPLVRAKASSGAVRRAMAFNSSQRRAMTPSAK